MLQYSLEVGICWAILYLVYITFLRRETFFSVNRWYLLGSLVLGLLIPVLRTIPIAFQEEAVVVNEALYFISAGPEFIADNITAQAVSESVFTLNNLLLLIYVLGVLFVGSRFMLGLIKIKTLYTTGKRTRKDAFTLIETEKFHLPFSFLNCVFFSKEMPINDSIEKILKHELTHVQSWHTLDVLFTEVLQVLFWFNPLIILYKKAIKESHEYVADASVLQDTSQKIYGQILLRQSQSGLQIALANHFFHSHIKKRLTMMKQKKSKWPALIKYLFAVPAILLLMVLFQSQGLPVVQSHDKEISGLPLDQYNLSNTKLYGNRISYGDTIPLVNELAKFSKDDFAYITDNIWTMLDDPGFNLLLVIDGRVSTIEEVKRNKKHLTVPVVGDGIVGKELYGIKGSKGFLGFHDDRSDEPFSIVEKQSDEIFLEVDTYPRFPGCEDISGTEKEKSDCAKKKMLEFVYSNLTYPAEARRAGIQGSNVIKIVVEPDGSVTALDIVRDIGGGTKEAVEAMIQKMASMEAKWTPGMKDGKAVRVMYHLPVRFRLEGDAPVEEIYEYFSFNSDQVMSETVNIIAHKSNSNSEEVFKVVEQMPRFPGCEDVEGTNNDKEDCAKKNMLEFIYTNLRYPAAVRKAGIDGTNVIQFVIAANGSVEDIKLVRDVGGGTGDATEAVIKKMAETYTWTPGYQRGKAVNVLYTLPVRFKLQDKISNTSVSTTYELYQNEHNPLKSYIEISFILPKSGQASISVFDVTGKAVKTVKDQFNKGLNTVSFNKADLVEVDGPLYYELESGDFKQTRKMIMSLSDKSEDQLSADDKPILFKQVSEGPAPLIVVDGKVQNKQFNINTDLDRDEIMSLIAVSKKDAESKYGAAGKNGAVEVVTKAKDQKREYVIVSEKAEELFRVVEEMPRFPGCEDMTGSKNEKEECSKKELLKFIYTNLNYPKEARENGIDGTAVVQFVIDKKGNVTNPKVVRDVEGAFEEAVLTVIDKMVVEGKVWSAGKQKGKPVNVIFTLPVKFLLEQIKAEGDNQPSQNVKQQKVEDPNDIETWVTGLAPDKVLNINSTSTLSDVTIDYYTDEAGPVTIAVYNTAGQLLKTEKAEVLEGKNTKEITLGASVSGLYIVTLTQENSRITRKIILN